MIRSAALLLLLAACAARSAERDPLAGRVAGEPVQCVTLNRNTSPQIVDASTILYRETNRRVWRTGPRGNCPALRPLTTLIVEQYGPQLCRNDRFRVLEPNSTIPSGVCLFSEFTPYDLPRR